MSIYRITYSGTLPGETFAFGVHVDGGGGDSTGAEAAAAIAMGDFWNDGTDGIKGLFSTDVEIVAVHAAELDALTGRQTDAAEGTLALTGTAVADMLPHEVAVAVTMRGAAPIRKNRGRFYLPPPSTATITNGRLSTASYTLIANGAALFVNTLQGAGFTPVVYHADKTGTPVVTVGCGDVPDSQRRRRNKLVEVRVEVGV